MPRPRSRMQRAFGEHTQQSSAARKSHARTRGDGTGRANLRSARLPRKEHFTRTPLERCPGRHPQHCRSRCSIRTRRPGPALWHWLVYDIPPSVSDPARRRRQSGRGNYPPVASKVTMTLAVPGTGGRVRLTGTNRIATYLLSTLRSGPTASRRRTQAVRRVAGPGAGCQRSRQGQLHGTLRALKAPAPNVSCAAAARCVDTA